VLNGRRRHSQGFSLTTKKEEGRKVNDYHVTRPIVFVASISVLQALAGIAPGADGRSPKESSRRMPLSLDAEVRDGVLHYSWRTAESQEAGDKGCLFDIMTEMYSVPGPSRHRMDWSGLYSDKTGWTKASKTLSEADVQKYLVTDGSEQRGVVLRLFARPMDDKGPRRVVDEIYVDFHVAPLKPARKEATPKEDLAPSHGTEGG
jgi:hypothetical protein